MRELAGDVECLPATIERLARITERPQRRRLKREATYPSVVAPEGEGKRPVPIDVVQREALLDVLDRRGRLAVIEVGRPERVARLEQERGIRRLSRAIEQLLADVERMVAAAKRG